MIIIVARQLHWHSGTESGPIIEPWPLLRHDHVTAIIGVQHHCSMAIASATSTMVPSNHGHHCGMTAITV